MVRFQKILCPVDFFPASERALAYAERLATKEQGRLKLLHVVPPILPMGYEFPLDSSSILDKLEEESRLRMGKLAAKLRLPGKTEIQVMRGDVVSEIRKTIRSDKPDLVAMGTHGHRGLRRWILGSTTETILRQSPVPVLTISAAHKRVPEALFPRIFVTTDMSGISAGALLYAFSIGRNYQSRVTILHVLEEMRALTSAGYRKELKAAAEKRLSKLVPTEARGWCDIDTRVEAGTPYHVILKVLKKEKADLVVMGTHGKGLLDRALLGSTTDRVVKAATCPVLLIPPSTLSKGK